LTTTLVNVDGIKSINFNHEVVLEEDEANDREEINEDKCQQGSQQNRPAVLCHRTYHIEQRLFPVNYVQQLTLHISRTTIINSSKHTDVEAEAFT